MRLFNSASYTFPALLSIALHAGLFVLVVWGWQAAPSEKQVKVPRYIDAKFVELEAKAPEAAPPKPKPKTIDLAAQRAEQERRRREQEAKRREEQRIAAEKAEQERKEKERQEKLAEQERLQKELELAERQQQLEDQLTDTLEDEEQMLQAIEAEATAQSYLALISEGIRQNWSRPPSARNGMKTRLLIQLVPTGRVVEVTVLESSGNAAFDRSAVQAVWRAEQFQELQEMDSTVFEQHFRQLRILFEPQDLRL